MTLKILLVEDDISLQKSLSYILKNEGFSVVTAACGEEAIKSAISESPDLILLDLGLPGMDGFDVCDRLKKNVCTRDCMIIILSGRKEVGDITRGLVEFADDYITKPFEPSILLARIQAVMRRKGKTTPGPDKVMLNFGGITINADSREVKVKEETIDMTKTEFDILYLLAGKPDFVFPRSMILDHVRRDNFDVTDRVVDFQISGIRKKIGDDGKLIVTVRGIGYKFVSDPGRK